MHILHNLFNIYFLIFFASLFSNFLWLLLNVPRIAISLYFAFLRHYLYILPVSSTYNCFLFKPAFKALAIDEYCPQCTDCGLDSVQRLSWVACALNFAEIISSRCSSCCALFSLSYGCSFCFNFCAVFFFLFMYFFCDIFFSFCVDFYDPVFTSVFNRNRTAAAIAAARTIWATLLLLLTICWCCCSCCLFAYFSLGSINSQLIFYFSFPLICIYHKFN